MSSKEKILAKWLLSSASIPVVRFWSQCSADVVKRVFKSKLGRVRITNMDELRAAIAAELGPYAQRIDQLVFCCQDHRYGRRLTDGQEADLRTFLALEFFSLPASRSRDYNTSAEAWDASVLAVIKRASQAFALNRNFFLAILKSKLGRGCGGYTPVLLSGNDVEIRGDGKNSADFSTEFSFRELISAGSRKGQ